MEALQTAATWLEHKAEEKIEDHTVDDAQRAAEGIAHAQVIPSTYEEEAKSAAIEAATEAAREDSVTGHVAVDAKANAYPLYEKQFTFDKAKEAEERAEEPFVPDLSSPFMAFASIVSYAPNTDVGQNTYDHGENAFVKAYDDTYHQEASKDFDQKIEDHFNFDQKIEERFNFDLPQSGWHAPEAETPSVPAPADSPAAALDYNPPSHESSSGSEDHSVSSSSGGGYSGSSGYETPAPAYETSYSSPSSSETSHQDSPSTTSGDSSSGLY